jgi:hypothetical protein
MSVVVSHTYNFEFSKDKKQVLKICKEARVYILPYKNWPLSSTINILPNKKIAFKFNKRLTTMIIEFKM